MTAAGGSEDRDWTPGNPRGEPRSEPEEPSERLKVCARDGCDTEFKPYRSNQKYCCDNCRKYAWEQRRRRRMAEHVVRELLTPERVEEAIASFEEDD